MDKIVELIPTEWWKAIGLLFGAGFILVVKQGFAMLLTVAKKWFENQKVEFENIKDIVTKLVTGMQVQDEKNKNYDRRLDGHDDEIRSIRDNPKVKYDK